MRALRQLLHRVRCYMDEVCHIHGTRLTVVDVHQTGTVLCCLQCHPEEKAWNL